MYKDKWFLYKIKWYNEEISEETELFGLTIAGTYAEAVEQISYFFPEGYIIQIEVSEVSAETNCFKIEEDTYNAIKRDSQELNWF